MRRSLLPIATLMVTALTCGAEAQVTAAQQSALRASCRSDFMSKCSGVTPGGKDALLCLQKNVDGLSAACKGAVSATLPPPAPTAAKPVEAAPPKAAAAAAAPAATPAPAPAAPAPAVMSAPPPQAKVAVPPRAAAKPAAVKPAAAVVGPAAAPAPTAAQQSAIKAACRSDFMSKCAGVQPGGKEALACLQTNVGSLSGNCKQAVSVTMAAMPATGAVTATPVTVTPAAPAARPPKAPLANAVVMLRACKLDLIRHCHGVEPGGGRELACLAAHEQDLTIRCKTARKVTSSLR